MNVREYDLPDAALLKDGTPGNCCMAWRPAFLCIVLGLSNQPETSLNLEAAARDNVPVYKRPSGGETVILSPQTLVVSVLAHTGRFLPPRAAFHHINQQIIRGLESLGVRRLRPDGISDICIGNRKILGSSIYRSRDRMLYHAVLNVAETTETISRYLKHPQREPEYRQGRSHHDFVASLREEGYELQWDLLIETLSGCSPAP